ncbi:MAG TPA: autotransporter outer membrane beta-barrel domain-containing protein [Arenimonas sp.]|jgi:uncharacterized protein YhjY with autotransporter beta-barrel domain|nr:autotransporter outer membrane beta-barrel domain-containing protein [Arenimonas sp.]
MRALLLACGLVAALTSVARAQSPDEALAGLWNTLCLGAAPGSELATRCAEIASGGPGSRDSSAAGNFLGEIPGQGRAATRDGSPDEAELRTGLAPGWSLFASTDLGRLKRRNGVNEAPFDGDAWAISAGIDWAPRDDWRIGLLLNHAREDLDFINSAGSTEVRYTGLMLLAGWAAGDSLSVDAYAGRLDGDYDLRRAIDYTLLSGVSVQALAVASTGADRRLAGLGLTWSRPARGWEWQLSGGVDWQRTDIDPYTETGGAGLAVQVPGRSITSRRGRVDVGLARNISTSRGVFQPIARLGWRHEFANPARPLTVRFAGDANGTPIVFETDDADDTWGEAGLGALWVFTGGHSAFVEYRQRFGHAFLDERTLALGWRVELP